MAKQGIKARFLQSMSVQSIMYLDLPQLVHNLSLDKMFFKQVQAISHGTSNIVCFMLEMHSVYFNGKMTEKQLYYLCFTQTLQIFLLLVNIHAVFIAVYRPHAV